MILRNKTTHHLTIDGRRVRPYRTIVVPDGTEYDKERFEVQEPGREMTQKDKDRVKDFEEDIADDGKRNRSNKKKGEQ